MESGGARGLVGQPLTYSVSPRPARDPISKVANDILKTVFKVVFWTL